jgi:hypothetical protein
VGDLEGGVGADATQLSERTLRTNSTFTDHKAQFWTMTGEVSTQCNDDSDKRNTHIAKPDKVAGIITQKAVDTHEDACSLR